MTYQDPRFSWDGLNHELLGRALPVWTQAGYAVRVSAVGYGVALRLALTTINGDTAGWVVTSCEELNVLVRGLIAEGWEASVQKRLERPSGRGRRR